MERHILLATVPETPDMPAFLVPLDSGASLVPLEKAILLVGRQADCDVIITHSRKVSRKHCCIAQIDDKWMIRDLGSTNGVTVNGQKLTKEAGIGLGDEVWIGDVRFKLWNRPQLPQESPQNAATLPGSALASASPERLKPTTPVPPPLPRKRPPIELSQEFPVALPDDEEGTPFVADEEAGLLPRRRRRRSPSDDVLPLASDSSF